MIELLRVWLIGVTAAAILCALANSLMPQGPVRKVGKLALGLVMLAALLRPLVQLDAVDVEQWLEDVQAEAAVPVQDLEGERDAAAKAIIEQACAAYIVDKAAQLGAECSVQIVCQAAGDGVFLPAQAVVQGALTPEQTSALVRCLEEDLGRPQERQKIQQEEGTP